MKPESAAPRVSVVMATYNRSNIIGYSIRSVLASTMTDWELIVVGDACSDDTEAVVRGFDDPRIRFFNLEQNCGEQSGPNNVGMSLARGETIAFLNHDDLWLPHHLQTGLDFLTRHDADLVFPVALRVQPGGQGMTLYGATTTKDRYVPGLDVPASLWLFRRSLMDRIGPWRPAVETRFIASQDWLYRAHQLGARLLTVPEVTALLIPSGNRSGSYSDRQYAEHDEYFVRSSDPSFVEKSLLDIQLRWEDGRLIDPWFLLWEGLKALSRNLLLRLGVFPPAPLFWISAPRKGDLIRSLRRVRGLPNVVPRS